MRLLSVTASHSLHVTVLSSTAYSMPYRTTRSPAHSVSCQTLAVFLDLVA